MSKLALRIGIIGCGYWGPNVIRNFVNLADSDVVALADLNSENLFRMKSLHPQIEYFSENFHDFFSMNLDAVVIATPPQTHHAIAKACLENSLHVLIEKPITLDSATAIDLINVAREHKRILMVGHTFEYNSAVQELRRLVQSGELGKIHYIDAVRVSLGLFQTHANALWDLAPHDISILRHILGEDPIGVSSQGSACVQDGIEDVVYTTLRFPKNIMAHCRVSWLDPFKTRRITVVGDKKMVIYDDVEPHEKLRVYDKGVKAIRRTDTFGEFSFSYHYGDIVSPYIHQQEPLKVQCQHFLDCINESHAPLTDGYNGLKVVEVLEAAQKSLENHGEFVPLASNYIELPQGTSVFPKAASQWKQETYLNSSSPKVIPSPSSLS